MRRFALSLILLFAAAPLAAELAIKKPGLDLRLQDAPCTDPKVLAHLPEQWKTKFRRASLTLDGSRLGACWIDEGEGVALVIEDGSGGRLPKSTFRGRPSI
jgi:hypothetical protein